MGKSSIQFNAPVLKECIYIENDFKPKEGANVSLKLNVENKYAKNDVNRIAQVILTVTVGEQSINLPFYIKVVYLAHFRWDESVKDPDNYLSMNAPALLYGYVRTVVSDIIAKSNFPRLDLPFLDFSSMKNNKEEINL